MSQPRISLLLSIIVLLAVSRWLPHPPNFSVMTATALLGGAYFARYHVALLVTGSAMLLSDVVLGFHGLMWAVYLSFALTVFLGAALRQYRHRALPVVGATFASSLLFFIVTNTAHWAIYLDYSHTMSGLLACYVAALPFFQNALLGDLLITALLFSSMAVLTREYTNSTTLTPA